MLGSSARSDSAKGGIGSGCLAPTLYSATPSSRGVERRPVPSMNCTRVGATTSQSACSHGPREWPIGAGNSPSKRVMVEAQLSGRSSSAAHESLIPSELSRAPRAVTARPFTPYDGDSSLQPCNRLWADIARGPRAGDYRLRRALAQPAASFGRLVGRRCRSRCRSRCGPRPKNPESARPKSAERVAAAPPGARYPGCRR